MMRFPSRLAGVLFDLDGVLIDSARAWHRVISIGVERYGFSPVSWELFSTTFGQGVEADQQQFFPTLSVDQVSRFYEQTFADQLEAVRLMEGAHRVLDALAARGLARAIVTNTPRPLAEQVVEHTGLAERVDALAAAGDAPEKPEPDLVLLALERIGLSAGDVVYVGDSASDRAATASAGVWMIGLDHPGDQAIARLDELLPLFDVKGERHPEE